ncbi:transposase [Sinimarinibacterium thermocellulolyticum]|uniref:Transposase n=1 Tax=Sinimarinibacterium thermocellulolyticum TaxID=3170016 RepID=A0ABV2AA47_9GAMM
MRSAEGKAIRPIDPERHLATQRIAERLATPEGKDHYQQRQFIPEPVFGWVKQATDFRRFSIRVRHAPDRPSPRRHWHARIKCRCKFRPPKLLGA